MVGYELVKGCFLPRNDVGLYVPDLPTFQKLVNLNVASLCPLDLATSKKLPNHRPTRHSHFFSGAPDETFAMTFH